MTLGECRQRVDGAWVVEGDDSIGFGEVVVSDLMSDVLVTDHTDFLLVTSLASDQVVRTADITDARAILLTNGKRPQPSLVELASAQGIPVLASRHSTFEVCRRLAGCLDLE